MFLFFCFNSLPPSRRASKSMPAQGPAVLAAIEADLGGRARAVRDPLSPLTPLSPAALGTEAHCAVYHSALLLHARPRDCSWWVRMPFSCIMWSLGEGEGAECCRACLWFVSCPPGRGSILSFSFLLALCRQVVMGNRMWTTMGAPALCPVQTVVCAAVLAWGGHTIALASYPFCRCCIGRRQLAMGRGIGSELAPAIPSS